MTTETVYKQLLAIKAKHPEMLQDYETDLTEHDRRDLSKSKAGQEYVWIIGETGTCLFRLDICRNPIWATYRVDNERNTFAFHIKVKSDRGRDGSVTPITKEQVHSLANRGYDVSVDNVLNAIHKCRDVESPIYMQTIERLAPYGTNLANGIKEAINRGYARFDEKRGLMITI